MEPGEKVWGVGSLILHHFIIAEEYLDYLFFFANEYLSSVKIFQ